MSGNTPAYAWLNGTIVPWDQCLIHARTQGAFWGANAFEGVRAYWNNSDRQLYIYRLEDHIARLRASMHCLDMPQTYSDTEITAAILELLRANRYEEDVHIVIVPYFAMGRNFDPLCHTEDTGMHITVLPMPRSPRYHQGAKAGISSWRRISDDTMPPRIKTGANYHNSRLAQHEAVRNGHDTAILLNHRATVAECPGSCLAIYRDGVLSTPPGTSGVLEGITINAVARLTAEHLPLRFERREIDRTELYLADEVLTCGTLAEIQPIVSVDGKAIGKGQPGPTTRMLQELYEAEVRLNPTEKYSLAVY
ncbi:aminotransferase class IV [Chitinimonas viridis]|uniref:Aminotransferase class IV n=1 Tax=Chitinimonas viridis TaxID=664880 RepID=A0ABT8B4V3_9NEIS|nr:aminotransferase class IV [Chitinimonas viridis]MDN3576661.1 aminotransferase class IV [Chitinimonas viridis]